MMYRLMKRIAPFLLIALLAAPVHAAPPQWTVDPVHSGIFFSVQHIAASTHGFFEDFTGTTYFDPKDLANSRFDFTVQVKSINTYNRKRDGHLRADDFFAVGKYPEMTFKSTRMAHRGDNRYTLEGELTVKDVTRNVTIPFTFSGVRSHPFKPDQEVAGFEARFSIDRLAYHVGSGKFVKMGVVGQTVDIVLSMEMIREK